MQYLSRISLCLLVGMIVATATIDVRGDEVCPSNGRSVRRPLRGLLRSRILARRARTNGCDQCQQATEATVAAAPTPAAEEPKWTPLLDGKTLDGWEVVQFGGEGDVTVTDGAVVMEMGESLTGFTYTKDFPKTGYEVRLEAQRADGIDFFCGLTFPVADSYCSFIVGGWAGAVVGLSSLDDKDASENETTKYMNFKTEQWYRIRVRVEKERIQCWIDDKQVVNQDIRGKKISIRNEVDLSTPLGFSAWQTKAKIKGVEYRMLFGK